MQLRSDELQIRQCGSGTEAVAIFAPTGNISTEI